MNWENGYTAEYYMSIVDPATWRDIERVEIVGGSVTRNLDGLRENATLNCQQFSQTIEQWVRIWLNAYQDGARRTSLFSLVWPRLRRNSLTEYATTAR